MGYPMTNSTSPTPPREREELARIAQRILVADTPTSDPPMYLIADAMQAAGYRKGSGEPSEALANLLVAGGLKEAARICDAYAAEQIAMRVSVGIRSQFAENHVHENRADGAADCADRIRRAALRAQEGM